jgi:GrpB-like predicted nucleotidyltransferase (UPF0157 family)
MPEQSLRSHRVALVGPDRAWRKAFDLECVEILATIDGRAAIQVEHIGSTSIAGIRAKPIIDILLGIRDAAALTVVRQNLEALGYEYDVAALNDDPERHVFRKGPRELRTHQVHVTLVGGFYWNRILAFRDYLREHPEVAREYEQLKMHLAATHANDGRAYTHGKGSFVRRVQAVALSRRWAQDQ